MTHDIVAPAVERAAELLAQYEDAAAYGGNAIIPAATLRQLCVALLFLHAQEQSS